MPKPRSWPSTGFPAASARNDVATLRTMKKSSTKLYGTRNMSHTERGLAVRASGRVDSRHVCSERQ
ncbi:MAG TPA: hypothetical protein VE871_10470 [Longimicrobium sp.]|nr:hypothetical protein [Longimicrobium sp.]